ncbi:hypothetical protein PPYR_05673 [Photinus pyralis]|uniref:Protein phosphatase methylesterase 1 n=1 Tax=Photinus pyralis TaxID=7054 RepID=A0A1Y1KD20_PHOPY|nr:protein phosphatase methylesterase 1 isoform X2 [Photinus pyralis]KAB0801319.1 hypothetical protein PPYR_05673 [Photinus pyralis]
MHKNTSRISNADCTPVKWSKYYSKEELLHINGSEFNVYFCGSTGPVLLLIHGGGYSALTWSLFAEDITHKIDCQILAVDLRGHGSTKTDDESNLSLDVLAQDIELVVSTVYGDNPLPIVLIGHSLGGAVVVEVASRISAVVGVCVIDVVEGTAIESLSSMQSILRGRPNSFSSIEQAIQWSYRSGQTHNMEAAKVSMPGQIKNCRTNELAARETWDKNKLNTEIAEKVCRHSDVIREEDEDPENETVDATKNSSPVFEVPNTSSKYTWRIDLSKTENYWIGWFKGLSQKFLNIRVPKVLLLANIHGLDTALTVGQMQGKFQLQVLQRSGHAIHEDQPHQVADIIAGFLVKQKLAVAKNDFTPAMPGC